ncbi:hypothetical protein VTP01DRAFT_1366 [Rhizomucor pusillus]|uniref:uncharacterized protein n=1 Tax=Rhizomucor pusillus TaxID=4840 RepID=UPI003741EDD8
MKTSESVANENSADKTALLYILSDAFVLVHHRGNVLRLGFDDSITNLDGSWEPPRDAVGYKIYGILGILDGVRERFLVVMTQIQKIGQICGHSVYALDQITCLDFHPELAREKMSKAKTSRSPDDEDSSSDSESEDEKKEAAAKAEEAAVVADAAAGHENIRRSPVLTTSASTPTVSTPLKITTMGTHQRPVSSSSMSPRSPLMSRFQMSFSAKRDAASTVKSKSPRSTPPPPPGDDLLQAAAENEDKALDRRLVRQVTELFSRSMFIFSYDYDLSNTFQRRYDMTHGEKKEIIAKEPLWKQMDRRFFWNEHLCREFKSRNLDEWIIPVLQGTVQIEPCEIEGYQFEFALISRRSRERAGMRYQRRGVNEEGQVANFVETEQVIIFTRDNVRHIASFVQTRGSIPLFWSQSPYSLHPIPTLDRTPHENDVAFERHFAEQKKLYGRQILVNLTELVGREAIVGSEYRKHVERLADPNIQYVEFDFHRETKGMQYENISKLSTSLQQELTKLAHFWQASEDTVYCRQKGVFRTNCMDCLDRTNVVQSAFGRTVLNLQLMRFGITEYPDEGIRYYEHFERIFNNAWANNGDMISRMYAGTSALKGDFTRTGKRNIAGMMNDASNSLTRMYLNTVKDFWRQATIDYVLGYHKIEIFRHVPQSTQMSAEPGVERRWAKMRQDAIRISSEIVIADDEQRTAGWTLMSPNEPQKRRSKKFDEKVVLITAKALYVCSYNYALEKVVQFKRISLDTIRSLQEGEYFLSALPPASRLAEENYGFLVFYNADNEMTRVNTGSMRSDSFARIGGQREDKDEYGEEEETSSGSSSDSEVDDEDERNGHFLAFRAIQYSVLGELSGDQVKTCREQVQEIVAKLAEACGQNKERFVIHKAIISLQQADKTDGIFKKMGYKIKKTLQM